jgi:CHAD domain-containing protein
MKIVYQIDNGAEFSNNIETLKEAIHQANGKPILMSSGSCSRWLSTVPEQYAELDRQKLVEELENKKETIRKRNLLIKDLRNQVEKFYNAYIGEVKKLQQIDCNKK